MMEVRDPIHGAIALDAGETVVADDPWFQRLRHIRQTGFSHLPFPGATHTRHAHALGVMHLAGRAFDSAYRDWTFERPDAAQRFRACVRLAALCHDLGHPPFSHCMEFAMPALGTLGVSWYGAGAGAVRKATHEDYTIAILQHGSIGRQIDQRFPFGARHVAALISAEVAPPDDFFVDGGLDHRRLLSQLVSSELDVDRLDYLVRDATFTGANYGQVDVNWLISNLEAWPDGGQVSLAMDGRAVYAFDHFLIARHHMFLMVYFHHKSVIYEEMLRRYVQGEGCDWRFPELDGWLEVDDVALTAHLRASTDPWARRVVEQRPFRRVVERHGTPSEADVSKEEQVLRAAGFDVIANHSRGQLSRYHLWGRKRSKAPTIWVLDRMPGHPVDRVRPLAEASGVFERYADARVISRLYVEPERVDEARAALGLPGR